MRIALVAIVLLVAAGGAASSRPQERALPDSLTQGFRFLDAHQLDQAFAAFDDARARRGRARHAK